MAPLKTRIDLTDIEMNHLLKIGGGDTIKAVYLIRRFIEENPKWVFDELKESNNKRTKGSRSREITYDKEDRVLISKWLSSRRKSIKVSFSQIIRIIHKFGYLPSYIDPGLTRLHWRR